MNLGRIGLWTFQLDLQPAERAREAVAELEDMGWPAIWIPEALGREVFTNAALLLGASRKIVVATGIANVWGRDAMAMAGAWRTLTEAHPDRFLLGLGVSHAPLVEGVRGHRYEKPLSFMKRYLDAMDEAPFMAARPKTDPVRVIGALHPGMLRLSAERASGAHPYLVTPEHTHEARAILGDEPILAPEQTVLLETDPSKARERARQFLSTYLGLPNYARNLRKLGFSDEDLAHNGSDRLVDALVAWGRPEDVAARVRAHHDAGASHVCIQVLPEDSAALPLEDWHELAGILL